MLQDKAILIIEDNLLLALDLASAVEARGGRAIGPAVTVDDAMDYLATEEIAAVVLDCHVADEDIVRVVKCIAERHIPVVLSSITEPPPIVAAVLPGAPMVKVPLQSQIVLERLSEEIAKTLPSRARSAA